MSILTQLRKLEKDRTRFKEIGTKATKSYQELQPKYSQAVQEAKNYQSTLTRDYNQYVQSRNQAVDSYNTELQQRYQTYQGAVQQGSGLERSYQTAQQELKRLEGVRNTAEQQANQLYGTYSSKYSAATKTGQQQYQSQLGGYQSQIGNLQKNIETYQGELSGISKNISAQQQAIGRSQTSANNLLSGSVLGGKFILDSTNKVYQIFTEGNQYKSAREVASSSYAPTPIPGGTVTDSGYGSVSAVLGDLFQRGYAESWTDTVYKQYQRGTADYGSYQQATDHAKQLSSMVQKSYDRISGYQKNIRSFLADQENKNQQIELASGAITRADQDYQNLLKDTGYVTRYAQQQSAGSLKNYQDYLKNTYNPSVASYNQYGAQTYNPAAQAYQNFMGSGQVQSALQSYQSLAQDTGYADRASSQAKQVYDASAQRYRELQTGYQQLEQPLSQYATEMKDASEQIQQLNLQIPGLQRSLKVEQDPRKRETRIGYGRSLMTSGTKRRSSAR
mgnify:CR=1 FL=1